MMANQRLIKYGKKSKKICKFVFEIMINIKTKKEIEIIREGGRIAARILNLLAEKVKPGITTNELDIIAAREIKKANARASFLGHRDYPASICTSINSEVVHGVPSGRILRDGDIVGLDLGIYHRGFHADTALTVGAGKIDFAKKTLLIVTKKALDEGISIIRPGIHLGDVQNRIQKIIEGAGFGVVRDLAGHGIGKELQEMPSIPNFGRQKTGPVLREGMVLAIEPMVSAGDWHVKILKDGWTVATLDGSLAAHFEHTLAVTKDGFEVLTQE